MFWKNQSQTTNKLQQHAVIVEQILAKLGVDLNRSRMAADSGYGWSFQRGSALIEVYIAAQKEREYLQVLSPLLHLPNGNLLPLYRRLLELNLSMTNASLGVYLDVVYVFNERPLDGLDSMEANFIITQIARYADELDNQLLSEFGGRLYGQV
ncbi:MAG: YbjN domain-containing protein [Anaerolineae bacterium]